MNLLDIGTLMKNRSAFTMIELVFVIVVLGILAAIAVPKFAATRDDAEVAKIRSDVASIRSAIVSERQLRLLRGQVKFISELDKNVASDTDNVALFDGNDSLHVLLDYPIYTSREASNKPISGKWLKRAKNRYIVNAGGSLVDFNYSATTGIFDCDHTSSNCNMLAN